MRFKWPGLVLLPRHGMRTSRNAYPRHVHDVALGLFLLDQ